MPTPPRNINGHLIVASAAASLALFALACVFIASSEGKLPAEPYEKIVESRARADSIAVLLDMFKVHKGSYPPSLEALEQEFGVKLDRPTVAHWEYSASSDGEYYSILICDQLYWDCYPKCRLVADGEWHIDS